jgi:hypothetical protein
MVLARMISQETPTQYREPSVRPCVMTRENWGLAMRKASEFRRHAQECRVLARNADRPEQRAQLIQMADTWERIADERERLIARHPELSTAAERDETLGPGVPYAEPSD